MSNRLYILLGKNYQEKKNWVKQNIYSVLPSHFLPMNFDLTKKKWSFIYSQIQQTSLFSAPRIISFYSFESLSLKDEKLFIEYLHRDNNQLDYYVFYALYLRPSLQKHFSSQQIFYFKVDESNQNNINDLLLALLKKDLIVTLSSLRKLLKQGYSANYIIYGLHKGLERYHMYLLQKRNTPKEWIWKEKNSHYHSQIARSIEEKIGKTVSLFDFFFLFKQLSDLEEHSRDLKLAVLDNFLEYTCLQFCLRKKHLKN